MSNRLSLVVTVLLSAGAVLGCTVAPAADVGAERTSAVASPILDATDVDDDTVDGVPNLRRCDTGGGCSGALLTNQWVRASAPRTRPFGMATQAARAFATARSSGSRKSSAPSPPRARLSASTKTQSGRFATGLQASIRRRSRGQVWRMDGGTEADQTSPLVAGNEWQVQGTGDFDGDGRSDMLWRHASGGLAIWYSGNPSGAGYRGDPGSE